MLKEQRLIREGEISAVNESLMSARVAFKDREELTSAEMPVLGRGSSSTAGDYWLPTVGDRAVCLMAPNDEQSGGGWIIGTRFSEKDPPIKAGGRRLTFGNGTAIEFSDADMNITVANDMNITISGKMNLSVSGDVSVSAGGTVYIQGSNVRLND